VPHFEPFRGIRYDTSRVDLRQVVAPPYDVLSAADRAALSARDPHNVVLVDVPVEADGPGRYDAAAATLQRWLDEGVLLTEAEPAYYLYRMTFTDEAGVTHRTNGVIGGLEVVDAGSVDAGVLPHEQTTPKARTDRLKLTRATGANLSPVWGLALARGLGAALEAPGALLGELTDDEGVHHRLELVDEPARVEAIHTLVAEAPVVIADGHHRYEVARAFRDERRATGGNDGPWEQTMAFVVELAEDQLFVQAIHRLLHDLPPGFDLLAALAPYFDPTPAGPVTPGVTEVMRHHGALCLVQPDGTGVLLHPRPDAFAGVRDLDSARLEHALAGVPHGVRYQHGVDHVLEAVKGGAAACGVLLRPVTVAQIAATAHEHVLMPPKSTFFAPKPKTGLVIRPAV
jgi:uncharacterized protein (DUF1015 family)